MGRQEGGRWDVGAENNAVHLERISDDDERLFDDWLTTDEARALAGLLNKYADRVEASENSASEDDEDDDDDEDCAAATPGPSPAIPPGRRAR